MNCDESRSSRSEPIRTYLPSKETAEREEVGQTRWKRERKSQKERPWKPTRGKPVRVRVRVRVRVSVRVNVVVFVVL